MDGTVVALVKIVAEYGVLGLGWIAWIFTMFYVRAERARYQALVIHIIQYFTKTKMPTSSELFADDQESKHQSTFAKLLGDQ